MKGKRRFGQGLVGRLLNREFTKRRIPSKIKSELDEFSDHRSVLLSVHPV